MKYKGWSVNTLRRELMRRGISAIDIPDSLLWKLLNFETVEEAANYLETLLDDYDYDRKQRDDY